MISAHVMWSTRVHVISTRRGRLTALGNRFEEGTTPGERQGDLFTSRMRQSCPVKFAYMHLGKGRSRQRCRVFCGPGSGLEGEARTMRMPNVISSRTRMPKAMRFWIWKGRQETSTQSTFRRLSVWFHSLPLRVSRRASAGEVKRESRWGASCRVELRTRPRNRSAWEVPDRCSRYL